MKGGLWDTGYDPEIWPDRETYRGTYWATRRRLTYYQARLWVAVLRMVRRLPTR